MKHRCLKLHSVEKCNANRPTTGDELGLPQGSTSIRFSSPRHPSTASASGGTQQHTTSSGGSVDPITSTTDAATASASAAAAAAAAGSTQPSSGNAAPPPVVLDEGEFDAYVSANRFLEWHLDLFQHPLATHRTGHTPEDVRAVIKAGEGWVEVGVCRALFLVLMLQESGNPSHPFQSTQYINAQAS